MKWSEGIPVILDYATASITFKVQWGKTRSLFHVVSFHWLMRGKVKWRDDSTRIVLDLISSFLTIGNGTRDNRQQKKMNFPWYNVINVKGKAGKKGSSAALNVTSPPPTSRYTRSSMCFTFFLAIRASSRSPSSRHSIDLLYSRFLAPISCIDK